MNCLTKKVAFISGSTSGLGKELSIHLAKNGYHVLIHGRNQNKLNYLYDKIMSIKGTSTIINLDLNDYNGIDRLGHRIFEKYKKLDLLVMNAAILGTLTPLCHQEPKEFEEVLNTNLIANFRLLRSLELSLRKSKNGKLCVISSKLTRKPKPFWGAYSVSKAALEQMIYSWHLENKKEDVKVYIIHPKPINTKLRKAAMPGENEKNNQTPKHAAQKLLSILNKTKNKSDVFTFDL
tara:strand:+ start:10 stop:714 length:705 start_codon:yes stop_codon:yes gene_type:complete